MVDYIPFYTRNVPDLVAIKVELPGNLQLVMVHVKAAIILCRIRLSKWKSIDGGLINDPIP